MFAGFNLTLNSMDLIELSAYKEQGDQLFKEQKKEIVAALEKYINVDGSLEASKIEVCDVASSAYLPHSGKSWLGCEAGAVMKFVFIPFVYCWRAGTC